MSIPFQTGGRTIVLPEDDVECQGNRYHASSEPDRSWRRGHVEFGTPREHRDDKATIGTLLTAERLDEKDVLGFDHDEYVDQVAWDVHPGFRPRGPAAKDHRWLAEAFFEVVGEKDRAFAASQLLLALSPAKDA